MLKLEWGFPVRCSYLKTFAGFLDGSFKGAKSLVAEWIHFTLFGIILPTIKLKVYNLGGL